MYGLGLRGVFVVKQRWFPFCMVTASSPSCTNNLLVQFALLGFWGGVGWGVWLMFPVLPVTAWLRLGSLKGSHIPGRSSICPNVLQSILVR